MPDTSYASPTSRRPRAAARLAGTFLLYTLIALVATWPLVPRMATHITSDPGDPILNTSILVWNATTVPLSPAWYNAPHYYPTPGATTLTENLLGLYPIATPVYWLTGNPLLAYNLTMFLTWPLAGWSVFLLVRRLAGRDDAAFLAGLAFAFTPYRAVALAHLQTVATFGVALLALGLHGYLHERQRRWLVLAALAWLHQGFANGYYILYGALFVGLWVSYFCSPADRWRALLPIGVALAAGSVPLMPMLLTYRAVHNDLGMHRALHEILYFSASPQSWAQVGSLSWLWSRVLAEGKDNMFPGLMAAGLVAASITVLLRRPGAGSGGRHNGLRGLLGAVLLVAVLAIAAQCYYGPIDTVLFGAVPLRMRGLDRAIVAAFMAGTALVWLTPRLRAALARRSPLVFYTGGVLIFAVLACGPDLRVGDTSILYPTPYSLLMLLPGFNELRVPTQIKMIHLLCLCVAAGLGYAALVRASTRRGMAAFGVVALGIMLEGWLVETPMADAQPLWPVVEPATRTEPLLELPLGPAWDAGATLRASIHHRRVVNGVSGYDPPYYYAIKEGLERKDPALLRAFTALGPIDAVVDREADPDGAYERYVSAVPAATTVADDGKRRAVALPKTPVPLPPGTPLPIAALIASDNPQDAGWAVDGRPETGWGVFPQRPGQWVVADLGRELEVGGVTHAIGDYQMDFPRLLAIDISVDGTAWTTAWQGPTYAETFTAFVRHPRSASLEFTFRPAPARFVRLRQLDSFERIWRLSELTIHAPHSEYTSTP
ncbi:MAG: discoidin domain-containing protein [Vicinamibacterales bacterium]